MEECSLGNGGLAHCPHLRTLRNRPSLGTYALTDGQSLTNTVIRIAATVMPAPEARSTVRLPPQSLVKQATVRFYGADRQFWRPNEVVKRHIATLGNSGRAMTTSVTPNCRVPLTRVRLSLYKH